MSDLSYSDYCVITRSTGEVDEWDNLVSTEIYSGVCDFQPGGRMRFLFPCSLQQLSIGTGTAGIRVFIVRMLFFYKTGVAS